MNVNDRRRDLVAGRDAELNRVAEVAHSRGEHSETILVTGPAGSGKTALVEAAAATVDADVLHLVGTPLGMQGAFETAINNIATIEQSRRFAPVRDQLAAIVQEAYQSPSTGVDLARELVGVLRTIPPSDQPTVVIFEDIHLFDDWSLQAAAFLARQNHLYDQAYVMTSLEGRPLPNFEGVERIRLGPLPDEAARVSLSRWSQLPVPVPVGGALNALADGNPRLLREIASGLTAAQLRGDVALPLVPALSPRIRAALADTMDGTSADDREALAAFGPEREVPREVAVGVVGADALAGLLARGLLSEDGRCFRATPAAAGWAAWQLLEPRARIGVAERLAGSWSSVSPLRAAYFRLLVSPTAIASGAEAVRTAFLQGVNEVPEVLERTAELCCRPPRGTLGDGLRWVAASLDAGHLDAGVEAWQAIAGAAPQTEDEVVEQARWRNVMGALTRDPAVGLAAPRHLAAIKRLSSGRAFVAWVLAARSALGVGGVGLAARYLDRAQELSLTASLGGRALWQLVDCGIQEAAGRPVPPEAYREALLRWCDHEGGRHWFDDASAVTTLTDIGDGRAAEQFLLTTEAVHVERRGIGRACLLAARLHLETAELRASAATATAEQLGRLTLPRAVSAGPLRGDLVRLHAVTGWSGLAYHLVQEQAQDLTLGTAASAEGHAHLVRGDYVAAATILRAALASGGAAAGSRWEVLDDLVEAYVATGDRAAGIEAVSSAGLGESRFPATLVRSARIQALLAPPFDVRDRFGQALAQAGGSAGPYRARVLLGYARRLGQLGAAAEAEKARREAAHLFGLHGLTGWQQHADGVVLDEGTPVPGPPAVRLTTPERRIVRLIVEGRSNTEIAKELFVSLRTTEKSLTRIYRKMGVSSRAELLTVLTPEDQPM